MSPLGGKKRTAEAIGQEAAVDTSLNTLHSLTAALDSADLLAVSRQAEAVSVKVLL